MTGERFKHCGPDVTLSLSGEGYGFDVDATACNLDSDNQFRCRNAISFQIPMRPGDRCQYRDGCFCRSLAAQLRALTLAHTALADAIQETKDEME
jgi:hypothetical protein